MNIPEHLTPFITIAEQFDRGEFSESHLLTESQLLAQTGAGCLREVFAISEQFGLARPRVGWALSALAETIAQTMNDPFMEAQAAWYVAKAANEWVEPQQIETAVERAHAKFVALGKHAWVAACNWQQYAQPWRHTDFRQAVEVLSDALETIEQSELSDFAAHCRLSLAYAQLLRGDYDTATANIRQSEAVFAAAKDELNLARCWLHTSSVLRRRGEYMQALHYLTRALPIFEQANARLDVGRVKYQLALVHWRTRMPNANAEDTLLEACEIFREGDVRLWEAMCQGALSLIYNDAGDLKKARLALEAARKIYGGYSIPGLTIDNLLDSGRLAMFRGDLKSSLDDLSQARELAIKLDSKPSIAFAFMYAGQVSGQFGRYFQALQSLERAQTTLQSLNLPERLAECEMQISSIWIRLGRADEAHRLLDHAETYFEKSGQHDYLISIYNRRAEAFFLDQKNSAAAVGCLRKSLSLAQQMGGKHQSAHAQRLLGEALLQIGQSEDAFVYIQSAAQICAELDARLELAACQVDLGQYYLHNNAHNQARMAYQTAIELSAEIAPEIEWQARAGLAEIYQTQHQIEFALRELQVVTHTLSKMRRTLWQPNLAGGYLQRRTAILDRSVKLAAEHAPPTETLLLIEESKAQTVSAQLAARLTGNSIALPIEIQDLAAEIRWLQEQLQGNSSGKKLFSSEQANLIQALRHKNRLYDDLIGKYERQQHSDLAHFVVDNRFTPSYFAQQATAHVGQKWVAIEYYLSPTHLICVVFTHENLFVWQSKISPEVEIALRVCSNASRNTAFPAQRDLTVLGKWLFPLELSTLLHPNATVLISPHRQLHQIPWAALRVGETQRALVDVCIPVITPSLRGLSLLWERPQKMQVPNNGFVLAIAQFQGRHQDLPQITPERHFLESHLNCESTILANETGTWEHLKELAQGSGLERFAFWHIASHAFHDALTGRLSGLALYDRDLWLDDLWDFAPLPNLITLSACNGTRSLVYAGDEHVGLAMTCLSAGARQVIGSLWSVLDEAASDLTKAFYTGLWQGKPPAQALAEAQRAISAAQPQVDRWGGYLCIGSPV